jgi:hypothetical protein
VNVAIVEEVVAHDGVGGDGDRASWPPFKSLVSKSPLSSKAFGALSEVTV